METTNNFPELDLSLALSKAEGNLQFLAKTDTATMTQGEAVLDALHAVQQARKHWQEVITKQKEEAAKRLDLSVARGIMV